MARTQEYVWKDGVQSGITTREQAGRRETSAGITRQERRFLNRCDPWAGGLLVLNLPATIEFLTFEELIQNASRVDEPKDRTVNGRNLILVKLLFEQSKARVGTWEVEVYLDPAVNYLVRRTVYTSKYEGEKFVREEEVVSFKECGAGVFFPERIEGRYGAKDTVLFEISEIKVNQTLDNEVFRLRFPHGVYLRDNIRGVAYHVDSHGNQISDAKQLGRIAPPPILENPGPVRTATESEPTPWTAWLLLASAGILLAAGLLYGVRRYRQLTRVA